VVAAPVVMAVVRVVPENHPSGAVQEAATATAAALGLAHVTALATDVAVRGMATRPAGTPVIIATAAMNHHPLCGGLREKRSAGTRISEVEALPCGVAVPGTASLKRAASVPLSRQGGGLRVHPAALVAEGRRETSTIAIKGPVERTPGVVPEKIVVVVVVAVVVGGDRAMVPAHSARRGIMAETESQGSGGDDEDPREKSRSS